MTALAALVLLFAPIEAKGAGHGGEEGKFDAKSLVIGHLSDSYEWHITEIKGKPLCIYLPVIVKSSTGWHIFSSRNIAEGEEHLGLYVAQEGKYEGKLVEKVDGVEKRPLDLSITKTVAGILINSTVFIVLLLLAARHYRRKKEEIDYVPRGLAGLFEWLCNSLVDGIIKPCVGKNYMKFAPFLLTIFFFIFINNLMGLIPFFPGGANVTGNIAVTGVLAISTFLMVNIFGSKEYYKEVFWPDVPIFLKAIPLMPIIEFIGLFTKPFALMIRLFANITAGHAIILSLSCIIFATAQAGAAVSGSMSFVAVFFMMFMDALELLVAFIQAYVFTMLSSVFIGLAQVHEEEGEEDKKQKEITKE